MHGHMRPHTCACIGTCACVSACGGLKLVSEISLALPLSPELSLWEHVQPLGCWDDRWATTLTQLLPGLEIRTRLHFRTARASARELSPRPLCEHLTLTRQAQTLPTSSTKIHLQPPG